MKSFAFISPNILSLSPALFDVREAPFSLHGLYEPKANGLFRRIHEAVANAANERVRMMHTNPAGARVRFVTNSSFIAVGAVYPPMGDAEARGAGARSGAGAFCFDLYVDGKHVGLLSHEVLSERDGVTVFDVKDGRYEALERFGTNRKREITLFFPLFVNVERLYVGLEQGCTIEAPTPYKNEKPVVFYGSSITQGACASRAGNTYPSVLSRRYGFDFINLGFAGGALAEDPIVDYLCTLDPCLLVFDYDHNAWNPDYLRRTHLPALCKLRAAHPEIPFILMSRPNLCSGEAQVKERINIIRESYEALLADGCGPVHFVNGLDVYHSLDSDMMTVDGTHPTDLGFYAMAKALSEVFAIYF
jgi:hypothetical protein